MMTFTMSASLRGSPDLATAPPGFSKPGFVEPYEPILAGYGEDGTHLIYPRIDRAEASVARKNF